MSKIWPRLLIYLLLTGLLGLLNNYLIDHQELSSFQLPKYEVAFQTLSFFGISISFIISFRNNYTYQRFHEGRELWGGLINETRNFTMLVKSVIQKVGITEEQWKILDTKKERIIYNAISLIYFIEDHLRMTSSELIEEIPFIDYLDINILTIQHRPNAVIMNLHAQLSKLLVEGYITEINYPMLVSPLLQITSIYGACERIKSTPIPKIYTTITYRLIHLYLIWLMIGLIASSLGAALVVIPLVAYTLFGFAEIGSQIENPFTDSEYTFDMKQLTLKIHSNLIQLMKMPEVASQ